MTFHRLLRRNLAFHWRAHLAVMLGVAVGSAVLTGALLVGDSLRGSLRDRAEQQRCGVDFALVRGQFFSADPNAVHTQTGCILHGAARTGDGDNVRRVSGLTILAGFDLTEFAGRGEKVEAPAMPAALAQQLGVTVGDTITIRIPVASTIPSESLLGQRESNQTSIELSLRLASILPDDHPASVFRLRPGFATARNIVVPSAALQRELSRLYPQFENVPIHNAILSEFWSETPLESFLLHSLRLRDLGLKQVDNSNLTTLEAYGGVINSQLADALDPEDTRIAPTLVYLANSMEHAGKSIPYSIVAALEPHRSEPLGPFLPPGVSSLADDEIILTDWKDSPLLGLKTGDPIKLTYFLPEMQDGRFVEASATFKLRGYLPTKTPALRPDLTPKFPGVTDRLSVRDWNPPFPYDNRRMQKRDEEFWRTYRTTPKAIVTLAAGRKLWTSRYGDTTSVRLAAARSPGAWVPSWQSQQKWFERQIVTHVDLKANGFVFDNLRSRFDNASDGGQDFGGLFLGFSFFLIASALLLVGLLTRLNVERRASEVGLLLATGWRFRSVRWLLLAEGLIVAAVGGLIGLVAAVGYAAAMIWLLRELWPDAVAGSFLQLHVESISLIFGYIGSVVVSGGTILFALFGLGRVPASALLAGQSDAPLPGFIRSIVDRLALPALVLSLVGAIGALAVGGLIDNPMFRALAFFGGGGLLLTAAMALIWRWLKRDSSSAHLGHGPVALARLGARNARRNPMRSLLTAGLLASAAFLLVAVESFRRRPEGDFERITGGSGGCPLIIETTQPLFRDLNSGEGRDELMTNLQRSFQSRPDETSTVQERVDRAANTLGQAKIHSFRKSAGDDASCLNLYQAGRPQILGVPASLIERGGFHFIQSEAKTPAQQANPWLLLQQPLDDGAIPVVGEQNTIEWMLKQGLGDYLTLTDVDANGQRIRLRIVGILKDSVFQSEILMSSANFTRAFPHTEGFTYHLVEAGPEAVPALSDVLRPGMERYEPEFTRSADRVAAFMAVENTYLTTFQLLGGFGLLLGALGLAVVMLRGIWERRSELALLRALGYRHRALGVMVLAENALLLLLGLAAGIGAAVLSVLPHLALGASIPWVRLALLLGLVAAAGIIAGAFAVRSTLRAPLLPALRKE